MCAVLTCPATYEVLARRLAGTPSFPPYKLLLEADAAVVAAGATLGLIGSYSHWYAEQDLARAQENLEWYRTQTYMEGEDLEVDADTTSYSMSLHYSNTADLDDIPF